MEKEVVTKGYPDVPSSLELMDLRQKALYFGAEITHIFKSSDKEDLLRASIVILFCGIFGNIILMLCIVAFRELHKLAYLVEIFRSLVEIVLMIIIIFLVNSNMFTVDDNFSSPIIMLIFIFLAGIYSSFQCMFKSIYIFLRLKKSKILKSVKHCTICSYFVVSIATALTVLFLGIMYCLDILAFVVFSFLSYYGPFVVSWGLEILKFLHFNNLKQTQYQVDRQSDPTVEYNKTDDDEDVHVDETNKYTMLPLSSPIQDMTTAGKFVAFFTGVVRCIPFSIMTMVIVRITWAFFRRSTPVPVIESVPSIMEQM